MLSCPDLDITLTFRTQEDAGLWMAEFNKMKDQTLAKLKLDPLLFANPPKTSICREGQRP